MNKRIGCITNFQCESMSVKGFNENYRIHIHLKPLLLNIFHLDACFKKLNLPNPINKYSPHKASLFKSIGPLVRDLLPLLKSKLNFKNDNAKKNDSNTQEFMVTLSTYVFLMPVTEASMVTLVESIFSLY